MEKVTGYVMVGHLAKPVGEFTHRTRRTKSAENLLDPRKNWQETVYGSSSDLSSTLTVKSSSIALAPPPQSPNSHSVALHQALEQELQRQRTEDDMSKQSTLPTGRAFAPAPIPQYMTSEQQQSGDSAGSQDSVRTQIPLSYHLPSNASHGPSQSYVTTASSGQQIGNITRPWGTPDLSGTATFENVHGGTSRSSRSLNPTSAPYVPPGYPPTAQSHGTNISMTSPYLEPAAQVGGMPYPPANPYSQAQVDGGIQLQSSYGGASTMNPYAHFGSAEGMNAYNPYSAGLGLQTNSYATSSGVSPAMSHASLASAQSTYQSLPYGPGTGAGVNAPTSYVQTGQSGAAQGWAGMYTPQVQYQAQSPSPSYVNPANAHRGKPAHSNSRPPFGQSGFGYSHPTSNLATAPVMNAAGNQNAKVTSAQNQKFGGPVLPPSKTIRPDSPPKSARESTHTSSPDRRSRVNSESAPTPGPKTQPLDLEFSSEPRNTVTPTLRSRRGQSISNAVTDPTRKQATSNWLDNIPDLGAAEGRDSQYQSPPKMLSLLGSGAVEAKPLSTINENDPFIGPSRSRATTVYNNPFAPKPQMPSPYSAGNSLIGPPTGPSPHLRALTSSGTRYPTFEEALDPKNFPFVEMCREAKEVNFGVIKIKNVSFSIEEDQRSFIDSIDRFLMASTALKSLHSLVATLASSMSKIMSQSTLSWSV
jgi:hypothetical protein